MTDSERLALVLSQVSPLSPATGSQVLAAFRPLALREGERLLRELGGRGSYIFAPAHALTGDIPPENIQAFLDLAREQPTP